MRGSGLLLLIFFVAVSNISWDLIPSNKTSISIAEKTLEETISFEDYATSFYRHLENSALEYNVFKTALRGYLQLQKSGQLTNKKFLSIIDFSKSSSKQRLFIIDVETKEIIHQSLVAHGRNSGLEFAKKFSNKVNSHQSSLGFYVTAETYSGKHGYSLRLDGLEYSNNNARRRAVVIHAADYAGENFVKKNGRLGRSFGCPSLPQNGYKEVISKIKGGSCLFIYYPKKTYLNKSKLANSLINAELTF
ncbi:MAG: murein L,D-transpeptidase catalytic domain family protein [Flavobacteriaceae bacterium]|nr:murein L,D-transpeptidase catalytic domain family protein [Flavobacteriaceae bacterium]